MSTFQSDPNKISNVHNPYDFSGVSVSFVSSILG
jgi:hypothetical protein